MNITPQENFKNYYHGFTLEEDLQLLKTLKRQITSYLKENSLERFQGLFNKIFILRKYIDKDKFYDILTEGLNDIEKERFIKFILSEGFKTSDDKVESDKIWEYQLTQVLGKNKYISED